MAKKKDRAFAEAIAASRLRCKDRLIAAVKLEPAVVQQQDGDGKFLLSGLMFHVNTKFLFESLLAGKLTILYYLRWFALLKGKILATSRPARVDRTTKRQHFHDSHQGVHND